jgi:hypothetical protein
MSVLAYCNTPESRLERGDVGETLELSSAYIVAVGQVVRLRTISSEQVFRSQADCSNTQRSFR